MTQAVIEPPSEQRAEPPWLQLFLYCWLMIAFAAAIAGAALQDYRIVQEYVVFRTTCLVAGIVAGVGMAFCLGGAMHYIDLMLDPERRDRPSWWIRLLLVVQKRLLFYIQLAASALVVAAIAAFLFNLTIPSPDYSMLYRGGYQPAPADPLR